MKKALLALVLVSVASTSFATDRPTEAEYREAIVQETANYDRVNGACNAAYGTTLVYGFTGPIIAGIQHLAQSDHPCNVKDEMAQNLDVMKAVFKSWYNKTYE